ncbi:MAG: HAMP domain-containing protein [Acidobacteria bacterium]|nr:HAMP domain-containing protein [Acidobacteriota bacterium]MBI3657752.1 HAMP domain-containing protein [Acidobacteriota bacterium]
MKFRSLTQKLLTFILALYLLLILVISLSYYLAKKRITEDRTKLFLEQVALDTADKIDLMLQEKQEELKAMIINAQPFLSQDITGLLDRLCDLHGVYDLLLVVDRTGTVVAVNTVDRAGRSIQVPVIKNIKGHNIREFPEELIWFTEAMAGNFYEMDWYASPLVASVYDYRNDDRARQYNIGFAAPIRDAATAEVIGVWCNILNWEFIQKILDRVEADMETFNLPSGYAFLIKNDRDTTIGHKYRKNREYHPIDRRSQPDIASMDQYGTKISERPNVARLYQAVGNTTGQRSSSCSYESPPGNQKISGLAKISDYYGWICGVGVNDEDIFAPVNELRYLFILVALICSVIVAILTSFISSGIVLRLKRLTSTAEILARGDLSQRAEVTFQDEIGILGSALNRMASSLAERNQDLLESAQTLEEKVRARTLELEQSNEALKKAYMELKATQEQLIHSEKLASLGQLVAGIGHEIKNPLNFIYGNTGFLKQYVGNLNLLLDEYDKCSSLSESERQQIAQLKARINYTFILEDLRVLVDNFDEGATRINAIVSDLRTFSRMDYENMSEMDIHASLEIALNLLRNQYKGRIQIHKNFRKIPKIVGSPGKINQVFLNLISNGIQAIRDRGDIWITTAVHEGSVRVEIRDSGMGIAPNHLGKIFEPFFTTKEVGQGTGLGLSISYGIIKQHGGSIQVESQLGVGSAFILHLPITRNELPDDALSTEAKS